MENLNNFKLSKAQMNNVRGGKKFKCHASGVEYGKGTKDLVINAKDADTAEDICQDKVGIYYYVTCIEVNP